MEETIVVKMETEKKEKLQSLAKEQGLNLSGFIRMILYQHIAEKESFDKAA